MTQTQTEHPRPQFELDAQQAVDDRLAAIQAHPSYHAVKAKNPHREPSPHELDEHAAAAAHDDMTTRAKIALGLDAVIAEAKNQVKHNAPVTGSIISQLEAIRALVG